LSPTAWSGYAHQIENLGGAKLVVYERQHFYASETVPAFHHGNTEEKPVSASPTPRETPRRTLLTTPPPSALAPLRTW